MKGFDGWRRFRQIATWEWLERNLPVVLVAATVVALVIVIQTFRLPGMEQHVTVGCVLVGSKTDGGWNESHYTGLHNACRKVVEEAARAAEASGDERSAGPTIGGFFVRENVPEEEASLTAAVDGLVQEGCQVVFLTSFGYGRHIDTIAKKHPRVAFFGISGKGEAKNSTSYFARLYQVESQGEAPRPLYRELGQRGGGAGERRPAAGGRRGRHHVPCGPAVCRA